jgi:hypothetical protein
MTSRLLALASVLTLALPVSAQERTSRCFLGCNCNSGGSSSSNTAVMNALAQILSAQQQQLSLLTQIASQRNAPVAAAAPAAPAQAAPPMIFMVPGSQFAQAAPAPTSSIVIPGGGAPSIQIPGGGPAAIQIPGGGAPSIQIPGGGAPSIQIPGGGPPSAAIPGGGPASINIGGASTPTTVQPMPPAAPGGTPKMEIPGLPSGGSDSHYRSTSWRPTAPSQPTWQPVWKR